MAVSDLTDEERLIRDVRKGIDRNSPTWKALMKWAAARRRYSEGQLAKYGLPMVDTENHRGRRAVLVELIGLHSKTPQPGDDAEAGFDAGGGELF